MLINALIVLVVFILFILAFMLFRTLTFARPLGNVEPVGGLEVDPESVAKHLAGALRFRTVSVVDNNASGYMPFLDMQHYLEETYPKLHTQLERKRINDYALLYTWKGSNPELAPVVLMAHQDVVPVQDDALPNWTQPPFDGVIADGYVWGRGAQDCKMQLIGIMEAVERLLETGFVPQRSVYLAFGHDEEVGGTGAKAIAEWFKEQGIQPEAVLDEGGAITQGVLPGMDAPIALVGVAEKGYLTLQFTVESTPGHSSTPPRETAIGTLSKALAFIEATPSRANLDAAKLLFHGLGPILPFSQQLVFANLWLFKGIVRKKLEESPATYALIHTTAAPTIFNAGVTDNVLPAQATARVNFRLLPGDTIADVCEWVRKTVSDERVKFEPEPHFITQASPFSRTDTPAYNILVQTIRETFDGVPVAPMLLMGGTDARNYSDFCESVYRFIPLVFNSDDLKQVHATNERVSVEGMTKLVQFFAKLIQAWD
jgi:carboxypeptidase PM20D1